jgi:hypothetical protein
MARAKEEPRGRFATLQDLLTEGSQVLLGQALSLGEGVQRRLVDVGRGVEEQLVALVNTLELELGHRLDGMLDALAVSLRRDLEDMDTRVAAIERRDGKLAPGELRDALGPVQDRANGAVEMAAAAAERCNELQVRLQAMEARPAAVAATDMDEDLRRRIERMDQRLTDLGREVGTKLGELAALRERLTRMESRVVDQTKDQIARAGESAGLRDRLARLETRLSDLSKEQLARAVETAGLRERVFRMEQRATGGTPLATSSTADAVIR